MVCKQKDNLSTLHPIGTLDTSTWYGKHVLVMGLGVHGGGLGVARWMLKQGAHVTVTDIAHAEALAEPVAILQKAAHEETRGTLHYVLGEHRVEDFSSHDIVVANPAVRPNSPWLSIAREAGATIETEMTLFFRLCRGPIIGITGTKGKTTTAMLTSAMVSQQYPDTVLAGNLRVSALETLEHITPTTPVVLELSSFQLVGLGVAGCSPHYASVTNFSPDHLNYHGTMSEYAQAKQHIFLHQPCRLVVLNKHDDVLFRETSMQLLARMDNPPMLRTFSTQRDSDADCNITQSGTITCGGTYLFDTDDIHLCGKHNLGNVLAAATLAHSFGVEAQHIHHAVRSFRGIKHRLELVRTYNGVHYINDTTATNPAAMQAALASCDTPVILLAGGADKGLGFETVAQSIARHTKAVVFLAGNATSKLERDIRAALSSQHYGENHTHTYKPPELYGPYDDLAVAVQTAQRLASPGDNIVLSPGCASFGMFRNEFHRGEEFRRIVSML